MAAIFCMYSIFFRVLPLRHCPEFSPWRSAFLIPNKLSACSQWPHSFFLSLIPFVLLPNLPKISISWPPLIHYRAIRKQTLSLYDQYGPALIILFGWSGSHYVPATHFRSHSLLTWYCVFPSPGSHHLNILEWIYAAISSYNSLEKHHNDFRSSQHYSIYISLVIIS